MFLSFLFFFFCHFSHFFFSPFLVPQAFSSGTPVWSHKFHGYVCHLPPHSGLRNTLPFFFIGRGQPGSQIMLFLIYGVLRMEFQLFLCRL